MYNKNTFFVCVIFAPKLMNFTDFYDKLLKICMTVISH